MSSLDENAKALSDFGLTQNQAKVYIAIVRMGITSVGQVSKASKVRREDVYRILPKLEKMGLIEKILGTPTKVRATPVEDALSILIKREQDIASKKVSQLMAEKDIFLRHFKANKIKLTLEGKEAQFSLLSQRDVIINKVLTMIKDAKKEINAIASRENAFGFIRVYSEELRKAINKGVKIRMISEIPEYEDTLPKILQDYVLNKASLELKCMDHLPCQCITCDNKQILVATSREATWGESNCLWTNNDNLVEVMQRNFEDAWHTAVNIQSIETAAVSEKLRLFLDELRPTSHVIFVYESQEAKRKVLFNYLKVGLEKGEAGVYVAAEETPTEIREAMKRFGIDTEKYEKAGALNISRYENIYIADGEFNMVTTMNSWNTLYNKALKNDFKGLRVAGETSWFFDRKLIPELIEYEKSLHRVMDIPMIAICAYNAKMLNKSNNPINIYTELARAHGTVLFAGIDNKLGRIEIRKA